MTFNLSNIIEFLSSHENINNLPTIEEIYKHFSDDFDDFIEIFIDECYTGFNFTLKDGTYCTLIFAAYKCILHSHSDYDNQVGFYIYKIDNEDLYVCASCLTLLKAEPKILEDYSFVEGEELLFPKSWNIQGIKTWLKKEKLRQDEYAERRFLAWQEREKFEESIEYENCCDCEIMCNGECVLKDELDEE